MKISLTGLGINKYAINEKIYIYIYIYLCFEYDTILRQAI